MKTLLLLLLLAVPCPKPHRSKTPRAQFMKLNPCPSGPDKGSTKRCRGWKVDHICPLACCGLDLPVNLQWLDDDSKKAKDRWELNCSPCGPADGGVIPGR